MVAIRGEIVSKPILADFRKRFGDGPNGELKELHSTCMSWPDRFAIPDWLYPRMVEKARHLAEKARAAREGESPAVSSKVIGYVLGLLCTFPALTWRSLPPAPARRVDTEVKKGTLVYQRAELGVVGGCIALDR
ncbi:hypothetical protein CPB85DRAFT_1558121 [Mucidula mucida]|nr:hypothetical protein CPB85DRAFT_1558121 [Mucidula mucida]